MWYFNVRYVLQRSRQMEDDLSQRGSPVPKKVSLNEANVIVVVLGSLKWHSGKLNFPNFFISIGGTSPSPTFQY